MTSVLNKPETLQPVVELGRSRAIAAGVDPSEYDAITGALESAADWTAVFRAASASHLVAAHTADEQGRMITAADSYLAAAACSHISTTLPTDDHAGHHEAAEAMSRALAIVQPHAVALDGETFHGTLVPQPEDTTAPLVLIVPGLDSSRVEFYANALSLQRRGLATLAIDGPGQGTLAPTTHMRTDYHNVVTEALDVLASRHVAPRNIGVMALSLGGYYGAQSLANDQRLRAGVLVSGPSRLDWDLLPELLQEILALRAGGRLAARSFCATVDVRHFAEHITQPVRVIDGENDVLPGFTNGATLAQLAPRTQHDVIPDGDHLIGNRRWRWLPQAADFLRHHLC